MNATKQAAPSIHSYADALQLYVDRKRRTPIKLDHNTYLEPGPDNHPDTPTPGAEEDCPVSFAVRLHSTDIVTFHANGDVQFRTGGWKTVTTRARIRQHMPQHGKPIDYNSDKRQVRLSWGLRQKSGEWSIVCERTVYDRTTPGNFDFQDVKVYPFQDGMTLQRAPRTAGGFKLRKD